MKINGEETQVQRELTLEERQALWDKLYAQTKALQDQYPASPISITLPPRPTK